MSQPTEYALQDRVLLRHHGREVEGWIRMKTRFPEAAVYDVQLDGELLKGLTSDKLKPIEAGSKRGSISDLADRPMPPVLVKGGSA